MRKIININNNWFFTKKSSPDFENINEEWEEINLPHTWNGTDGQDGGNDYYRSKCFYAKTLSLKDLPKTQKKYLEINGANSSADVYLNGKQLFHHDGGYSCFRVEITEDVKEENLLVIAVDNSANDKVYPQTADFTFYGGLYRDVNIIGVDGSHFDLDYYGGPGIKVTPIIDEKDARVKTEVFITERKDGQKIVYSIFDKEGKLVISSVTNELLTDLVISDVHLWDGVTDPYLYSIKAELIDNNEIIDTVCTRFGCRTFRIDPENGFYLNEREYPLRGVCRHQDRKDIGNALKKEHHLEDMNLICEMGANTIRLAHYQHDQYFYDLCDEKGIVVWAEIPYISKHMKEGRDNTVTQMKELIAQNYNHPSIMVWGISNEITMMGDDDPDMLENHHILNDLVHEMDKTRLTAISCLSGCPIDSSVVKITDVVSYNHYFGWYGGNTDMNGPWFDDFHKKHPDIPIGCSEYGCEALNWHSSKPVQGDYTEEYQSYYHEELIKQFFSRKYIWATHVWNMFDFGADGRNEGGENGQNHKGLVTIDRKYRKDAFYAYKAWLSKEPFVHICSKRYIDRTEDNTVIKVYSNQKEVELFVNGASIGKKAAEDHFFSFLIPNINESRIVAIAGNCKDESLIRKVDSFNEDYRLNDRSAVLNWFDVTAPEGYLSLNDSVEDVIKSFRGKLIFVSIIKKMTSGNSNKMMGDFEMTDSIKKMISGFSVLRLIGMSGAEFEKEELLELNRKLNRVKKDKVVKKN